MSQPMQNGDLSDSLGIQINDDEGLVDKRTKEHILNLRQQIDNDERELFVNWPKEDRRSFNQVQAVQQWAVPVKQYLRAIKRLWHTDGSENNVRNVEFYWRQKTIAEYELTPPDKDGYQFSLIGAPDMTPDDLRNRIGLPRGVDVPQQVTITVNGLQEILDRDRIGHTWTVYVEKSGARPNWNQKVLTKEMPLPKDLLTNAVEVADDFLQQAGVGFKIGNDLPSWGYEELGSAIDDDDIDVV